MGIDLHICRRNYNILLHQHPCYNVIPYAGLAPRESADRVLLAGFELLLAVNLGLLPDLGGRLVGRFGSSNFGGHCNFDGSDVGEVMSQVLNS